MDVVEDDDDDPDEDELASVGSKSVVESISGSTAWKKANFIRNLFFFMKKPELERVSVELKKNNTEIKNQTNPTPN